MTAAALISYGRRVMAATALRLARLTLRAAIALHRHGAVRQGGLRAALAVVQCCERTGAVLAVGRRRRPHGARRARATLTIDGQGGTESPTSCK